MPAHSIMGAVIALAAILVAFIIAPFILKPTGSTSGFIPAGTAGLI